MWAMEWGGDTGYLKHHVKGSELLEPAGVEACKKLINIRDREIDHAKICFVHTRAATKGSPDKNINNHPVFRKDGTYILVHNGVVQNDDDFFRETKVVRQAEVDTEALVAALDMGKDPADARKKLVNVFGSYAIAAMPLKKVDHVLLLRNTSPVVYCFKEDVFYFASTAKALATVFGFDRKAVKFKFMKQLAMPFPTDMKDDTYFIITKDGIQEEGEHKVDYQARNQIGYRGWVENHAGPPLHGPYGGTGRHYPQTALPAPVKGSVVAFREYAFVEAIGKWTPIGILPELMDSMGFGFLSPKESRNALCRKFSCFPILRGNEHMLVKCPACWNEVDGSEIQARKWHCPECTTTLIPPDMFRETSEHERKTGRFYST